VWLILWAKVESLPWPLLNEIKLLFWIFFVRWVHWSSLKPELLWTPIHTSSKIEQKIRIFPVWWTPHPVKPSLLKPSKTKNYFQRKLYICPKMISKTVQFLYSLLTFSRFGYLLYFILVLLLKYWRPIYAWVINQLFPKIKINSILSL